jgi:hypothetical protein
MFVLQLLRVELQEVNKGFSPQTGTELLFVSEYYTQFGTNLSNSFTDYRRLQAQKIFTSM